MKTYLHMKSGDVYQIDPALKHFDYTRSMINEFVFKGGRNPREFYQATIINTDDTTGQLIFSFVDVESIEQTR